MKIQLWLWMFVLASVLAPAAARAEDEGGQKKYGVIHNIAEDRQVERVGGIYEPEGIDKYMKRRFDDLAAQMNSLDSRLAQMESQIEQILKKVEALPVDDKKTAENPKEKAPEARLSGVSPGRGVLVGSSGRTEIVES